MTERARRSSIGHVAVRLVASIALAIWSCGCTWTPHKWTFDFTRLKQANRIEITDNVQKPIATITDGAAIDYAAVFIEQYQDGWIQPLVGAAIPPRVLNFYLDKAYLGGFGIGRDFLAVPLMNRPVPANEISTFADGLGLQWPLR